MKRFLLVVIAMSPLAASAGPPITTKTTGLYPSKSCKTKIAGEDGSDPVLTCPAMKGYQTEVSFSATDTFVTITGPNTSVTISGAVGNKLEWQLSNGVPFAILVENAINDTDENGKPIRRAARVELAGLGAGAQRDKVEILNVSAAARKRAWATARTLARGLAPTK